ncbi:Flp family type IVb pilin [Erysipelothrix rhusiopathiae]|nr:Flp family type IVb pilin [Erysipelothrix rhusiopathiae]MDE8298679.1 Flp family type IVb pilin [Erysipelothrix rhusiopathiae]
MKNFLFNEESGQGMVEYGLILVLVSVVVIVVMKTLGGNLKGIFEKVGGELKGGATS